MDKIVITEEIFSERDYKKPIPFSKIKNIVQDDDIILSGWEEPFYSENNSYDGHYYMVVKRNRLETDDEFSKRISDGVKKQEELKEKRYQRYLELKKEFENNIKFRDIKWYKPHEDSKYYLIGDIVGSCGGCFTIIKMGDKFILESGLIDFPPYYSEDITDIKDNANKMMCIHLEFIKRKHLNELNIILKTDD